MMLRQLKRLHSEEQGMALVVSLMVAFVILMLSTVVVAQSIHSLDASGYDRQRLTSYNAAEAGANAWWEDLQTTALRVAQLFDQGGRDEHPAERSAVLGLGDVLRRRRVHDDGVSAVQREPALLREDRLHGILGRGGRQARSRPSRS